MSVPEITLFKKIREDILIRLHVKVFGSDCDGAIVCVGLVDSWATRLLAYPIRERRLGTRPHPILSAESFRSSHLNVGSNKLIH
jgi:hypothetical protein